jgi:phosphoribosylamine--glycine ligase
MGEILIAGETGGREHALGLALQAGEPGMDITFTHGNAGTADVGKNLGLSDNASIFEYASKNRPRLVVIGSEAPLVAGLADALRAQSLIVFGPGADGAQLEASKVYATTFATDFGVPQPAALRVIQSEQTAVDYVRHYDPTGYVIKADGLAGGKGVYLPNSRIDARNTMLNLLSGRLHGNAGKKIVIQERLAAHGPEFSAFAVTDGYDFVLLPIVQDHKRLLDGDVGPNTGGMGAYAPVAFADDEFVVQIEDILERTLYGLHARGIDYRGVLFLGGMIDAANGQPNLLEYNVRFGDPETQVLMPLLQAAGVNVYDLLLSAAEGDIHVIANNLNAKLGKSAVTFCLADKEYPQNLKKQAIIHGLSTIKGVDGVIAHHGGTEYCPGSTMVRTAGGRVLSVTAVANSVEEAVILARRHIGEPYGIYFDGMQYRSDIGSQALLPKIDRL